MGALSVTSNPKYQAPFAPLIPGVDVGKVNDIEGIKSLIVDDTCAVIVEPVQGEGGIHPVNVEWLRAVRQRCDEVGAVLIFDEIQVMYLDCYRPQVLWLTRVSVWLVPIWYSLDTFRIPGGLPPRHRDHG